MSYVSYKQSDNLSYKIQIIYVLQTMSYKYLNNLCPTI